MVEAYLHCAKALRRAGLWSSETWLSSDELPSAACIIKDQRQSRLTSRRSARPAKRNLAATLWEPGGNAETKRIERPTTVSAERAEELPHVADQQVRRVVRRPVAAAVVLVPVDDVGVVALGELADRLEVARELGQADRDVVVALASPVGREPARFSK